MAHYEGTEGEDVYTGTAGDDTIDGNGGNDWLSGGTGGNDQIDGGEGNDTVSFALVQGLLVANLALDTYAWTSDAEFFGAGTLVNVENLTGTRFSDVLIGDAGANILDGGFDGDRMEGGLGDDIYYVDDNEDLDTPAVDQLFEGVDAGIDTVCAITSWTLGANFERLTLLGSSRIDATGNALDNILIGNVNSNDLIGGGGADRMVGGRGDDGYWVDAAGDVVVELDGEGNDTVNSSISYSLAGKYVEMLNLIGNAAVNGTGNGLDNRIVGNAAANVLYGMDGNDWLDGGAGADRMRGGLGDDTFRVDNVGDVVQEDDGEGYDIVEALVSYSLVGTYVERLDLRGGTSGTGNGLDNEIIGNNGNNILNGMAGADTLRGSYGDDRYIVDNAGDRTIELNNQGHDVVESSVTFSLSGQYIEELVLTGTAAINGTGNGLDNSLFGNAAANLLSGGDGNDQLNGGLGNDQFVGGAGQDGFWFDTAPATNNFDRIFDFTSSDDTIYLDRTIFTGIAADGQLAAGAFVAGTAAMDADDRIIYDAATGRIWYDADGSGAMAATLFAGVKVGTTVIAADFFAVP